MLFGAGQQGRPVERDIHFFDLALTDKNFVERTWCRFSVPQNTTVGIHRICIQFDPDNATSADRLVIWVDGVRKTDDDDEPAMVLRGTYVPARSMDQTALEPASCGRKYNRVARWNPTSRSVRIVEKAFRHRVRTEQLSFRLHRRRIPVHTELLYSAEQTDRTDQDRRWCG